MYSHQESPIVHVLRSGPKVYIVAILSRFGSFSHHPVCSGPNQLKRTKMQSRDNIRFTCWLDVSLNTFPQTAFRLVRKSERENSSGAPGSKLQQTAHCYYGETTSRVDFIPGHPLLHSLHIPLQAMYNF